MAEHTLKARLVHCAYTAAQWATDANKVKVLKKGELGLEITLDSNNALTATRIKVGDGTTQWQNLPYVLDSVFTAQEKAKLAGISEDADKVSFKQTLTSGTELGTITINDVEYKIYSEVEKDTVTRIKYSTNSADVSTEYQTGDITLGAAAAKQVDGAIAEGSTSTNLVTTGAVVAYIDEMLEDMVTSMDLGTAAKKDFTDSVTANGTDLPTAAAVAGYVTGAIEDLELGDASKKDVDESIDVNSSSANLPTSAAVAAAIKAGIGANDAMVYKGVLSGGAELPAADRGHTYKVDKAGTISKLVVEVGDMLICTTDSTPKNTPANWNVIQANIDGAVVGPAASIAAHVAVFNGTTGKVIADSGFTIGSSVPENAVFTDTKPKFNDQTVTSDSNIYAPTAAGTSGQFLVSTGSTPGWKSTSELTIGTAEKLSTASAGGEYIPTYFTGGKPAAVTGVNVSLLYGDATLVLDGNF
jgi:hypothetical protein